MNLTKISIISRISLGSVQRVDSSPSTALSIPVYIIIIYMVIVNKFNALRACVTNSDLIHKYFDQAIPKWSFSCCLLTLPAVMQFLFNGVHICPSVFGVVPYWSPWCALCRWNFGWSLFISTIANNTMKYKKNILKHKFEHKENVCK